MGNQQTILPGRCYWVIEGVFLAGNYPYNPGIDEPEEFLKQLLSIGINTFIDLTEEDKLTHYQPVLVKLSHGEIFYRRFEIMDYSVPTLEQMQKVIAEINLSLKKGRRVYLHCRGGIGRTGTTVGCWLRDQGLSGQEALDKTALLFSASNAARYTQSPETEEQKQMVINYQLELRE
ncbi:MAG: hypothetical protein PHV05_09035 [Candidatus Riflebacteria bacterium]|nr:hypothetical protein [Candidatus Riflebacteria bacterium]